MVVFRMKISLRVCIVYFRLNYKKKKKSDKAQCEKTDKAKRKNVLFQGIRLGRAVFR